MKFCLARLEPVPEMMVECRTSISGAGKLSFGIRIALSLSVLMKSLCRAHPSMLRDGIYHSLEIRIPKEQRYENSKLFHPMS
jgi:hypothetical protein